MSLSGPTIVIRPDTLNPEDWLATVDEMPGVFARAETLEELVPRLCIAIADWHDRQIEQPPTQRSETD